MSRSYNPTFAETKMVWAVPRSLATTKGITFVFFSYGYLDVSVPHVRSSYEVTGLQPAGLPHSDIHGSKVICTSPRLFAAYHVLLRLREPRHPPSALIYFLVRLTRTITAREGITLSLLYNNFSLLTICNFSQHVKDLCLWRITDSNR